MANFSRELIIRAAGDMRPGDTLENHFANLSEKTGIGIRSLWAGWRDEYMSAKTRERLEKQAQLREQAANNADNLASTIEALALEAEMAGRPRRDVDVLRAAALALRNSDVPAGPANDREV